MSGSTRERAYAGYDAHYGARSRSLADEVHVARHVVVPFLPASRMGRILEVGAGEGLLIEALCILGVDGVGGIDISEAQVSAATAAGRDVVRADLHEYLAGINGALDAIIAFDLFEHLTRDEGLAFLDAARRALRPGGRLIMRMPNGGGMFATRLMALDVTHEQLYTASSIRQQLHSSGLAAVAVTGADPPCSRARRAPVCAARALLRLAWRVAIALEWGPAEGRAESGALNLLVCAERPVD